MDKKTKTLPPVRVSEIQEIVITQAAEKKGRKVSDWVRWCAYEASKRVMGMK